MPITKTAKKQLQVSRRNHARNQHFRSIMKSAVKEARAAITVGGDRAAAQTAVSHAVRILHRSATRRIIKRQNASRRASRLMRAFNAAFAVSEQTPAAEAAE